MKNKIDNTDLLIIALVLILILIYSLLICVFLAYQYNNKSNVGELGSIIGGILGPFVSLFGSMIVYFAFREQRKANKITNELFFSQSIINQLDMLSDKFMAIGDNSINNYLNCIANLPFISLIGTGNYKINRASNEIQGISKIILIQIDYFLSLFLETSLEINKYQGENTFLYNKAKNHYSFMYEKVIHKVKEKLDIYHSKNCLTERIFDPDNDNDASAKEELLKSISKKILILNDIFLMT
jgi:hypothetical protein